MQPDCVKAQSSRNKAHGKSRAAVRAILDRDGAAVSLDNALDDRKPEPRAFCLTTIAAPEALKYELPLGNRNALAAIKYTDGPSLAELDFDGGARRCVFDRIFDQVADGTVQHLGITLDAHGLLCAAQG